MNVIDVNMQYKPCYVIYKTMCKKTAFDSKEEAVNRIKQIKKEGKRNKTPRRSYKCVKCGKFHLTSMTKEQNKKVVILSQEKKARRIECEAEYWIKKN
ncbi:MAG: hypothetical protein ACKO96_18300, partial [Flammeovirgaceae bacterium]